ncbi:MAG: TIM barrel protein, partial [Proteobacteria bacterium]|nr:TIM barrel protein [Pseudomonadota bacterium]
MVPNYPNPPQAWVDEWHAMVAKYRLVPTNLDTFVDIYVGGHRTLSLQESVDVLVGQIKLANRMGFPVVRPTTGPVEQSATDMIERALPTAEKLDVRIAPEIHAPIPIQGKYIESYLELIHRTGTKHMGFTLDCGVFCTRLPRVMLDYWLRHGAQPQIADYVSKAYEDGQPSDKIVAAVQKMNPTEPNMGLAYTAFGYGP